MLERKFKLILVVFALGVHALPAAFIGSAAGATQTILVGPAPTPPADNPPYSSYKGVSIGMTADQTRSKLGNPKERSDGQDFFQYSDNESVQVFYDAAKTVTAIMVTYIGRLDSAPTPKTVFGEDVQPKPDGGIFKMVRYPKAGFWISYNRSSGDDPMINIAMQKIGQ